MPTSVIVQDPRLTPNNKLILSLTHTLGQIKGFNSYTLEKMSLVLGLHPTSISRSISFLIEMKYMYRDGQGLKVNQDLNKGYENCDWYISIPVEVYSQKIRSGAKILWGEYDSLDTYEFSRKHTADRLGCSQNSVSNWTKQLYKRDLIYYSITYTGKNFRKKSVKTCSLQEIREDYM